MVIVLHGHPRSKPPLLSPQWKLSITPLLLVYQKVCCQTLLYEMTHHFPSMQLLTDSASAIAVATSEDHHHRSKHIDIRYSFIKDVIKRRNVSINWVSTLDQLADVLTKSLSRVKFIPIRDQLLLD